MKISVQVRFVPIVEFKEHGVIGNVFALGAGVMGSSPIVLNVYNA